MKEVTFKLASYEGPLDLLYQLIKKNEVDIYDIPIAQITEQYMACLAMDSSKNMEEMSEFIVLAATLLEIKSKMLLPKAEPEEPDPREDLVARLLEYQRYKAAAALLQTYEVKGNYVFYKDPEAILDIKEPTDTRKILEGISIENLHKLFQDMLNRKELKTDKIRRHFNSVSKDIYTIEDKINFIRNQLSIHQNQLRFEQIISPNSPKMEIVVVFLALLELIRSSEICVVQSRLFETITITKNMEVSK